MAKILLFVCAIVTGDCVAQALWGELAAGQYPVGFKLVREHDNTRDSRPMVVSLWYPAVNSASSKPVLFKDYLAAGANLASPPSDSEKVTAYEDFHKTLERPFISGQKIPDDRYNAVLNLAPAATWNLPEAKGKFPSVIMSSEPESLSITAEYLASHGFVVAAINAPYGSTQPPDSLLWVQPTQDIQWLLDYVTKLGNVDAANISALGFGGGIQSAFYLTMKTDRLKSLVNLEGGVFGPRSLTNKSIEYHPEKMKTPMLHIIGRSQQNEDDQGQQRALINTKLYKAFLQRDELRHHDFSIYGRVLNAGLKMRGDAARMADDAYVSVHKMILEFLQLASAGKATTFAEDRRYMPLISLQNEESGLVLHQPAMDKVVVEEGKKFRTVNDTTLLFDIYYPPGFDKKQELPVVVFVNGIGSLELYRWKIYQDWAKLIAANGMIAINYQDRRNRAMEDSEYLLDYLASNSHELSIDKERIGLWSCSANVGTGLPLAMKESRRSVKALVVYYGSAQSPPNTRPSYRQDLEIQIVRSGLDFYNLNVGIENFVKTALLEDLHFEYINYPEGQHAFDAFDDTPRSREIILQTVDFLKRVLSKDHPVPAKNVLTNSRLWSMIITENKVDEALKEWNDAMVMYRKMPGHSPWYNHIIDERNLNQAGYQLLQAGRTNEALKVFMANQEQFPASANAYDAIADAYEKAGDKVKAVSYSRKAIEKITPDTRGGAEIRKSAEDKIKRLQ